MIFCKTLAEAVRARQPFFEKDAKVPLTFYACELAGEAGEACNKIKKIERERLGMPGSRATILDVEKELADTVICAYLNARELGIDLDAAIPRKFNEKSEELDIPVHMEEL